MVYKTPNPPKLLSDIITDTPSFLANSVRCIIEHVYTDTCIC